MTPANGRGHLLCRPGAPLRHFLAGRCHNHTVANTDSLFEELQRRGFQCGKGSSVRGSSCIIQTGPNGKIDPAIVVYERIALYPDQGRFHWEADGHTHRKPLDVDTSALADAVIASIRGR